MDRWKIRAFTATSMLLLASGCTPFSTNDEDAFASFSNWCLDLIAAISRPTFWTVVRAACILGVQTLACAFLFANCRPKLSDGAVLKLNWACCFITLFILAQIPLVGIPLARWISGWIFALGLLAIASLPWCLSFFLAVQAGRRKQIAIGLYAALALVLVIQLFR